MKVIALVPAAGMGRRMAAGINKQYLLLAGMPILARTLSIFQQMESIDDVHVVIPADEIAYCREHVVERYALAKVRSIIAGGAERQYSVLNGLRALQDVSDDDVILIHDGVRPCIPVSVIEQATAVARMHDGALVAVPAKDTIKIVADGIVTDTPPRESLWLAQTPQAFRYGIIRDAHERAAAEGYLGTDDASLVERLGLKVHVVPGDYRNIKVTTPDDMQLAETFLRSSQA